MHIATAIQIFILLFWLVPAFRMWRARTKLNIFEELEDLSLDNNNEANSMVSIIVPIRNEEKRFQDAFKTLLNQTYPNFEVIAVNDRSTDRSKEILTELASSDPRVTAIHVEN